MSATPPAGRTIPAAKVIPPGSTIGVLGSGQLGRMLAVAARRMGYRIHTLSPASGTPTGQLADREVVAEYEDLGAVEDFARQVDVVTFEFENVSSAAADVAARHAPVRPAGSILHTTQNRLREKTFLADQGLPIASFFPVRHLDDLHRAVRSLGRPGVLKTAGWGYDGKGQARIDQPSDAAAAWQAIGRQEATLEALVEFRMELSVIVARGLDGAVATYPVFWNRHLDHILDLTVAPAPIGTAVRDRALDIARQVAEATELVGVLCVEMFLTESDRLLINELAPRPHNSGHLTFGAAATCQFEQQLRAVCGLPLGSTRLHRPAAMANLLGDLWIDHESRGSNPDYAKALVIPGVSLHLYGKSDPRPGRKMGHLTAMADLIEEAERKVLDARDSLRELAP